MTSMAIYLLLAIVLLASQASPKPRQSRKLKFQTENPYVLPRGSELLVISKNQTHIRIDSSDRKYSPCEIEVDAVEHKIPGRIEATLLDSQKIIVYGVHNDSEKLLIKSVFHVILIVDPQSCELKTLKGLIQDKVPLFFPVTSAEIVARQNGEFDVFYLGPKECSPCRFDKEGKRVKLEHQIKANEKALTDLHVRQFGKNDYAYALNLDNGSSLLKVLDQNFKVVKQHHMNNSLFDFSTSLGTQGPLIGATYNTPDSPYEFYYELYNSSLQPIFTNRLDELDSDHLGLNAHFNIDSRANSFVSFQQMSAETGERIVSLVGYDSRGKKNFHSFEFTKIPNDALYETQTLLVDNREYCLVLHKLDEPLGETKIECIDVASI